MLSSIIRYIHVFALFLSVISAKLSNDLNAASNYVLVPCIENSDCEYVNGTCIKNFCSCNNSYNCKARMPVLANKLGETCNSTTDCNIDFAVCNENKKCTCDNEYIHSSNERKCLKTASGLGGDCEESTQCYTKTPSTGCHENKCVCQQHMHEYKGSCYKNVGLGEPCQLFGECSLIAHAGCVNSNCQCDENYISNRSACLLKANGLNFSCSEDIQCLTQLGSGSECFSGLCSCKELYHFKPSSNQCVHDILLNEVCGKHSDCHQPGTGPSKMECVVGVCKCKSPYLEESGICLSSSTSVVLFKSVMLFLGTIVLIK